MHRPDNVSSAGRQTLPQLGVAPVQFRSLSNAAPIDHTGAQAPTVAPIHTVPDKVLSHAVSKASWRVLEVCPSSMSDVLDQFEADFGRQHPNANRLPQGGRIQNTLKMIKAFRDKEASLEVDPDPDRTVYRCCSIDGRPAGLMAVYPESPDFEGHARLLAIVTLPGTSGTGKILFEKAVDYSKDVGCGGKLALEAIHGSEGVWSTFGFAAKEKVGNLTKMTFDPSLQQ